MPCSSRVDPQRRWVPDIATRFRDDEQKKSPRALKTGWNVASISQIADHCLGKMLDKQKNRGALRPYLRNLNVRWFDFDLSDVLEMRFENGETDRYQARKGDLIVCEGGYPGRAAIWDSDEPVFLQKALHRVRFHEPERAKWVLYWLYLRDMSGTLMESFNGAGIQHFTKAALARFEVPLPPLAEQKRIVAVLDQAFAALDRARAHTEASLADANLLYASTVDELMQRHRSDWQHGTVNELVGEVATGPFGSLLHKSDYVEAGIPIVNPSNIVNGVIEPDWSKTVSAEAAKRLQSYRLQEGDLVVGRRGEMGRCAFVPADVDGWLCGTGSFFIRTRSGVSPEFVAYLMRSSTVVDTLTAISTGATMPNLSNRALAEMALALPDMETQLTILAQVKRIESKTKELCSGLNAKLAALAALRQSLLQKAFAGELT